MFRRWRVRHSYPKSIVELVVRLEPTHGAVALSRLLDIPTSAIYRWRSKHRNGLAPTQATDRARETLSTLVARCKEFGFQVAPYVCVAPERARTSMATLRPNPTAPGAFGNSLSESAVDTAPASLSRNRAGAPTGRQRATDASKPSPVLMRRRATGRYVFNARNERPVRRVLHRMLTARHVADTQYFLDVDCRMLAETAGMSLHHFIRTFSDMFGMPPHQYLTQARVLAAKRLLLVSNEPIEVIAAGVGFQSGPSLNRAFKRIEGTSVSKYCKTVKKGVVDPPPLSQRS